jgi:aryl-alcohol dehydrogenase-like predicted oxidoreductase
MHDRTLGRTGIKVSRDCLGAMMYGGIANSDHDACIRIIHKALDSGINFVDTADRYSNGESAIAEAVIDGRFGQEPAYRHIRGRSCGQEPVHEQ